LLRLETAQIQEVTMRRASLLLVALAVLGVVGAVSGATIEFIVEYGDWNDYENWDLGVVPDGDDIAVIPTDSTCVVGEADQAALGLEVQPGARLIIAGKILTLGGGGYWTYSTLGGTIELQTANSTPATIKVGDGHWIQPPEDGQGLIDASGSGHSAVFDVYHVAPGYPDTLRVDPSITVKGNIQFWCNLWLDGVAAVDGANDTMILNGHGYAHGNGGVLRGSGSFEVSDGLLDVGFATLYTELPAWHVTDDGEIDVYDWYGLWEDVPLDVTLEGGLLDMHSAFSSTHKVDLSGGTIKCYNGFGGANPLTISGGLLHLLSNVTTPLSVYGDMAGDIDIDGNVSNHITISGSSQAAGDVSGAINIDGQLSREIRINGGLTANAAITIGSMTSLAAVTVDYDGWEDADDWASGATVTVDSTVYDYDPGNYPDARIWRVQPCRGDLNNDGELDGFDIDPFYSALGGTYPYMIDYPGLLGSRVFHGDCNCDSEFDGFDIDPFFERLTNAICSPDCDEERGPANLPSASDMAQLHLQYVPEEHLDLVVSILTDWAANEDSGYWSDVVALIEAGR
jgi:hypothetical protein